MSDGRDGLFPGMPITAPMPGTPDLDAYYDNASRSVPQSRTSILPAFWSDQPRPLVFAAPGGFPPDNLGNLAYGPPGPATIARAVYQTPIFDLMPELGAPDSVQPQARPISVVPIAFRGDLRLNVTIRNIATVAPPTIMQAYSVEAGDPVDPAILPPPVAPAAGVPPIGSVPFFMQRQNITAAVFDFAPGIEGVSMVSWRPPRGLRYWRVSLVLDITVVPTPGPGVLVAYGALE